MEGELTNVAIDVWGEGAAWMWEIRLHPDGEVLASRGAVSERLAWLAVCGWISDRSLESAKEAFAERDGAIARAQSAEQRSRVMASGAARFMESARVAEESARVAERAAVVAYLRTMAKESGDPRMAHIADGVAEGLHREVSGREAP